MPSDNLPIAECRLLWRAVRDGAIDGVRTNALEQQFAKTMTPVRVRYRVDQLCQAGYLRSKKVKGKNVWVLGCHDMPEEDGSSAGARVAPDVASVVKTLGTQLDYGRVNSIWALAARCAG
jgi:hypothetical protein